MGGNTGVAGGLLNAGHVGGDFAGAKCRLLHIVGDPLGCRTLFFHSAGNRGGDLADFIDRRSDTLDRGNRIAGRVLDRGNLRTDLVGGLGGRQAQAERLCRKLQRRLRDECLNEHLLANLNEACQIIDAWLIDYNNRPHARLNGLTPPSSQPAPIEAKPERTYL